ncbi:MAG: hypothetical protein ABMA13_14005 [Chthoniobacteraceae bacterium]
MHIGAVGTLENSTDSEYHEEITVGSRPDAFDDLNFVDTATSLDAISLAVNPGQVAKAFYVRLNAGDSIQRLTVVNNYQDLIVVKSGSAIAYFTDINGDNEYEEGEFTGVSLSANALVDINGTVYGDIVTNLDTKGTKIVSDDTVDMAGLVGSKQGIRSLFIGGGTVQGSILSGGDINGLTVINSVENVYAGAAAHGKAFSFFSGVNAGNGMVIFQPDAGVKGASITNVQIGALNSTVGNVAVPGELIAGAGGAGANGGSLTNIRITGDSDGFRLVAGDGGDADPASGKFNGGAGGKLSTIYVAGVADSTTPNSEVLIKAGAGGDGATTGRGGAGGTASKVQVGFEINGGRLVPSDTLLDDNVRIEAGAGGSGQFGGAGGKASAIKVRLNTRDQIGGDVEIAVLGGIGGDAVSAVGRAGVGGSVDNAEVLNQINVNDTDILIQAGKAGTVNAAGGNALGAAGGSVSNVKLLGSEFQVIAGDGSDGKTGGNGGSVKRVMVLDDNDIIAQSILIYAGHGGDATGGSAGSGGVIDNFQVVRADLAAMLVNPGNGGNGGNSIGGKAGRGGGITTLIVKDIDFGLNRSGFFTARAGLGGDGEKAGGAGGVIKNFDLAAVDLSAFVNAGAGGDALVAGRGGAGGGLQGAQIVTSGSVGGANVSGSLSAGAGGDASGVGKAGGKGGDVSSSKLVIDGDPTFPLVGDGMIVAGAGGGGSVGTGAAGSGGSISRSGIFVAEGSASLIAGDAGSTGGRPGTGGSITGTAGALIGLRGNVNLTAQAGDGSFGGAGGSITNLNYGNANVFDVDSDGDPVTPTPAGTINIIAGNGSQGPSKAGRGGSISNVNGSASSGLNQSVLFLAGDGGGDVRTGAAPAFVYTGSGKAATGGSISNLTLSRGGALGGLITFEAGDGGHSGAASNGAAGGHIDGVGVTDIALEATLRSFAAGDGGDAVRRGGIGGSVLDVNVLGHDIGVRSGKVYGYTEMGGVFAGLGGRGVVEGKAGNVVGLSADSIAAIVAGKGDVPGLVEKISDVTLNGGNQLLFRNNSFAPHSDFQLTYGGQTTPSIPGNATSQQIAAALNLLPGIADAGGITVLTFTSDGGYVLQFGSAQVANTDASLTAAELEIALEALPTVLSKGGVTTSDQLDGIHVQFNGGGIDAVLPVNATPAQLAAALNSTGLSAFGSFKVTQSSPAGIPGDFVITFQTIGFGDQQQITGVENVPVKVLQTLQGAIGLLSTSETLTGEFGLPVTETRSGSDPLIIQETVRGEFNFVAGELTMGDPSMTPPVAEVQQYSLVPLNTFPTARYTLNFNGEETGFLTSAGTDLTLAAQADAALESLSTIQALNGPGGNKVQVTVSTTAGRTFNVAFSALDGDVNPITGRFLVPETQRVNLGALSTIPGATFMLGFGADTTGNLSATPTIAEIDAALEALPAIQALAGPFADKVSVLALSPNTFDITFNSNGDKASLTGATSVPEIQTLDLAAILAVPGATFRVNFDGQTTFTNETTPEIAAGATDADTALAIQVAMNNLDSVKATAPGNTGSVMVSAQAGQKFLVTFSATGEQNAIVVTGFTDEVQNLDLNSIIPIPTSEFTLSVKTNVPVDETRQYVVSNSFTAAVDTDPLTAPRDGQLTDPEAAPVSGQWFTNLTPGSTATRERLLVDRTFFFAPNPVVPNGQIQFIFGASQVTVLATATDAQIDAAIESMPSIQALTVGAVNNRVNINHTGALAPQFNVEFNGNADINPNLRAIALVQEVQQIDTTNPLAASNTVLSFQGLDTIVLPTVPTAAEVQTALNALASIAAIGGVTVANAGGNLLNITFTTPGDVPTLVTGTHEVLERQTLDLTRLLGTGATFTLGVGGALTAPLAENSTAAQIQAALDPLVDDGSALNGNSDVVVTQLAAPGQFEISFTTLRGNLPEVIAQATLGTGTTTRLPGTSTATDIEAALDLVTVGGVTVTAPGIVAGLPVAGTFGISFNDNGDQPAIVVNTYVHEIQTVDVYDVGQFFLRFGNLPTALLDPPLVVKDPFAITPAELLDLDAKALAVENALNGLVSIAATGGVDVVPTKRVALINGVPTDVYENTSFDVIFRGDGDQNSLAGEHPETMPTATIRPGSPTVSEQQTIRYFAKNEFDPTAYASANLVGAISDINEHDANVFRFVNLDGSIDGFGRPTFTLGDRPLDGILMAKIFDQATVNFTPEARLTASGFFDNDNRL